MAYPLNRALIACSVSTLALAIVTLYYWQLRKRRKSSAAPKSDAPNLSCLAESIASDIIPEDCTDSSSPEESSSPLVVCASEESPPVPSSSTSAIVEKTAAALSLEPMATASAPETPSSGLVAQHVSDGAQSNGALDKGADIGKDIAPIISPAESKSKSPPLKPKPVPPKAAATTRKPISSSSSVKLSQTFAQVLSSKGNSSTKQAKSITESNGTKSSGPTPTPVSTSESVPVTSYASVTQEKDDSDAYHNYPDATTTSQASLSEGQCSPNSEFGECSDVHSLGSSDSGKGSSEVLHAESVSNGVVDQATSSPYQSIVNPPDDQLICYQFELPHYLCGKLIGAGGHFINSIKQRSGTSIVVSAHYFSNSENKICSITGTKSSVNIALGFIRRRFPSKEYPNISLRQINMVNPNPIPTIPLSQACQLHLPPDIVTDVILSCTINAGHFFLQQPTHPSYPQLNQLDQCMKAHYSQGNAPQMPQVYSGIVCAAPTEEGWYRALIKTVHESNAECDIMFVDYGGYAYNVPVSTLRQIRYDFLSLPFQASECYLANVMPLDVESDWTPEANRFFVELAQGQIIYAAISDYTENGIPIVNLFKVQGSDRIFINRELVENGHGTWIEHEPTQQPNNAS